MIEEIILRLKSFGYEATDEDQPTLTFVWEKVKRRIRNACNIQDIPDGLFFVAVDMAVGYFLQEKKAVSGDSLAGFDLSAAVKSIKEGDTDVSFAVGEGSSTPEQRFNSLIDYLIHYGEKDFVTYRQMVW